MTVTASFSKNVKSTFDTIVLPVFEGKKTIVQNDAIDEATRKTLLASLKKQSAFTGKNGEIYSIPTPTHSTIGHVILCGLGAPNDMEALDVETIGGKLFPHLKKLKSEKIAVVMQNLTGLKKNDEAEYSVRFALGLKLRSYYFDAYKTDKKPKAKAMKVTILTEANSLAAALFKKYDAMANGVFIARDLMNEPPNKLYPASFADKVKKDLKPLGIEIEIFDEKKMEKLGFHSHLAVGMGSARKPRVLIMRWNGLPKNAPAAKAKPIAFIGKGVTFDTGGISLKPGPGMEDMKMDMGGSAAVVGLMKSLALRQAKVNVVGIVGLAENMPSSNAYRPGDIIQSMGGKTIEVLNTDAEGRLVLIDALAYVQKRVRPKMMIDLATLTGAMMVALGTEYCGAFVNSNSLWDKLNEASSQTGEKLWRMPFDKSYKKEVESQIADLKNLGGKYGGACTAAAFLEHFVTDKDVEWAHLDIAGKMIHKTDSATVPAGGVGFGVRLLDRLVANHYE